MSPSYRNDMGILRVFQIGYKKEYKVVMKMKWVISSKVQSTVA